MVQAVRIAFTICTITVIVLSLFFVVFFHYRKRQRKRLLNEPGRSPPISPTTSDDQVELYAPIILCKHEILVRYRSREIIILPILLLVELLYLIQEFSNPNDELNELTNEWTWFLTLVEFQLILIWFLQEQRGISEINMLLRILSLTISLFFGWVFILLSIWHSINEIRVTLYIVFVSNALIAIASIVHNIIFRKAIRYIKVESRVKPILANLMLFLVSFLSIAEVMYGVPIDKSNDNRYESFFTLYRLFLFICCTTIVLMISIQLPQIKAPSNAFSRQRFDTAHGEMDRTATLIQLNDQDLEHSTTFSQQQAAAQAKKDKEKASFYNQGDLDEAIAATQMVTEEVDTDDDYHQHNNDNEEHSKKENDKIETKEPKTVIAASIDSAVMNEAIANVENKTKSDFSQTEMESMAKAAANGEKFKIPQLTEADNENENEKESKDNKEDNNNNNKEEKKEEKKEEEKKTLEVPQATLSLDTWKTEIEKDEEDARKAIEKYSKRFAKKQWNSVTTTFIGDTDVGKTLFIRSLWRVNAGMFKQKYKKKSRRGTNTHRTRRLSQMVDSQDLLDYNRYNMIDLYRRWDPILRVKFKFWDTVGDLRFISSILECMRQSEVIVALYRLSYSDKQVAKTVEFIVKIDRLIHNILLEGSKKRKSKKNKSSHHNDNDDNDDNDDDAPQMADAPQDVSIRTMHGAEFELDKEWDVKFGCMLIGISTQPLNKILIDKHFDTLKYLERKCNHLKFRMFHPFYINYYVEGMPRMVTLLETLVDIEKMKKLAIEQYINDPKCCCNLMRSWGPMYNFPTKINIKSQPFVLRKVQSQMTTIKLKDGKNAGTDTSEVAGFKRSHIGSSKGFHGESKRPSKIKVPTKTQQAYYSVSNVFGVGALDERGNVTDEHHHHHGKTNKHEKTENLPNKVVAGPIASVHHWRLERPKLLIITRFFGCLLSGIMFPFLVVMQTCVFWSYCEEWGINNEGLSRIMGDYRISEYGTFLLDFLYPIFPRPSPDPLVEQAMGSGLRSLLDKKSSQQDGSFLKVDWFFRQTFIQKIFRTIVAFSIVMLATFGVYNVIYFFEFDSKEDNYVSKMESLGGMIWFGIIWFMISTWYGHRVITKPSVDLLFSDDERASMSLHYKDTTFNKYLIDTNVDVFLRSYSFYHAQIRKTRSMPKKIYVFISVAAFYSIIPSISRVLEGNPFFGGENYNQYNTVVRGYILNFILVFLSQYVFESAFYSYFREYKKLMTDITSIIEIPGASESELEEFAYDDSSNNNNRKNGNNNNNSNVRNRKSSKKGDDASPVPHGAPALQNTSSNNSNGTRRQTSTKGGNEVLFGDDMVDTEDKKTFYHGSGFEFLSLDDPENLISWMEIRSYAYVKGRQLFAELELFIAFFCVILISQAIYVTLSLFLNQGVDSGSRIVFAMLFLFVVNAGWLMRVFILGTKFDQLQRRQQYAMVNQMTCIRSEALSSAYFTGPIGWIQLKVGKWNRLYKLLHMYSEHRLVNPNSAANLEMTQWYLGDESSDSSDTENEYKKDELLMSDNESESDDGNITDHESQQLAISVTNDNEANEQIAKKTFNRKQEKAKLRAKLKKKYEQKMKEKRLKHKMKRQKRKKEKLQRMRKKTKAKYEETKEAFEEMQQLQDEFDQYLNLLDLAYDKLKQNSIHPKIFGMGLSGALLKTLLGTFLTTALAVAKFVFF